MSEELASTAAPASAPSQPTADAVARPETAGSQPAGSVEPSPPVTPEVEPPPPEFTVPLSEAIEYRVARRKAEEAAAEWQKKAEEYQTRVQQWDGMSDEIRAAIEQRDQLARDKAIYEQQLRAAQQHFQSEGIDWKPPDVSATVDQGREAMALRQQLARLEQSIPEMMTKVLLSREDQYRQAESQRIANERQTSFEKELDTKLAAITHVPIQSRQHAREMFLNDAKARGFNGVSVEQYLQTMRLTPAPQPAAPQPKSEPGIPSNPARETVQDDGLGEYRNRSWDDFLYPSF